MQTNLNFSREVTEEILFMFFIFQICTKEIGKAAPNNLQLLRNIKNFMRVLINTLSVVPKLETFIFLENLGITSVYSFLVNCYDNGEKDVEMIDENGDIYKLDEVFFATNDDKESLVDSLISFLHEEKNLYDSTKSFMELLFSGATKCGITKEEVLKYVSKSDFKDFNDQKEVNDYFDNLDIKE